jgi:alkanesulfonate monooxygenase
MIDLANPTTVASDSSSRLELFATCPESSNPHPDPYRDRVTEVARWSERAGYRGILIYTDNRLVDPWLVAQLVVDATEQLSPLVAVQPIYMHPYTVAKIVASIGHVYGRRVYLNMVAGGFPNDLHALGDNTAHDERYDRAAEYGLVVKQLLAGGRVSFDGRFYQLKNVVLTPALPPDLMPGIFVSGSSDAGMRAARTLGATAVKYPKPPDEEMPARDDGARMGIRVGVVAREDAEAAWNAARARFPEDRRGRVTHALAMKTSDSQWHRQLSRLGANSAHANPYWLGPFENYKTFCPYLVGSYDRVADELERYLLLGFSTFILDIPPSEEELGHTAIAFERAAGRGRKSVEARHATES